MSADGRPNVPPPAMRNAPQGQGAPQQGRGLAGPAQRGASPGAPAPRQGPPDQAQRKAPPQQARPPQQQRPAQRQAPDAKQAYQDLHIRVGLEDELVRVTAEQYYKILYLWELGNEDIIIRITRKDHEVNIVLRGNQNAVISIRAYDPNRRIPVADVVSCEEMRLRILEEQGIVKK